MLQAFLIQQEDPQYNSLNDTHAGSYNCTHFDTLLAVAKTLA